MMCVVALLAGLTHALTGRTRTRSYSARSSWVPPAAVNTLAGQATLFTDDTIGCAGPVVPGPDLYEWARMVAVDGHEDPAVVAEARGLTAWSHPSRAFQGHYYAWFFDRVLAGAPATVE